VTAADLLAGTPTPPGDSASPAIAAAGTVPGTVPKQTGAALVAAFPPRPMAPSWPATEASRAAVLARVLSPPFALDNPLSQQTRRLGVLAVLSWLHTFPGTSWQQRWQVSAYDLICRSVYDLTCRSRRGDHDTVVGVGARDARSLSR
jgi:hypothetical protein